MATSKRRRTVARLSAQARREELKRFLNELRQLKREFDKDQR